MIVIYLVNNCIGDEGCKPLIDSKWKNLTTLTLCMIVIYPGNNSISDEGCKYLNSTNWEKLTELSLGILIIYYRYEQYQLKSIRVTKS